MEAIKWMIESINKRLLNCKVGPIPISRPFLCKIIFLYFSHNFSKATLSTLSRLSLFHHSVFYELPRCTTKPWCPAHKSASNPEDKTHPFIGKLTSILEETFASLNFRATGSKKSFRRLWCTVMKKSSFFQMHRTMQIQTPQVAVRILLGEVSIY